MLATRSKMGEVDSAYQFDKIVYSSPLEGFISLYSHGERRADYWLHDTDTDKATNKEDGLERTQVNETTTAEMSTPRSNSLEPNRSMLLV
jgi:hypothetical protein